jgi:stage V sporulation protein D (sporulation-specific penicillin-binding protein)
VRQVIKPDTARAIVEMMVGATEGGTGKGARLDGYVVAGKTATAEKPASTGGYDPGRYVASFLGLVPVPDPRLAILVALDEPRGAYSGGEVAAPVFKQIATQVLWYLRIPPAAGRAPSSQLAPSPVESGTR